MYQQHNILCSQDLLSAGWKTCPVTNCDRLLYLQCHFVHESTKEIMALRKKVYVELCSQVVVVEKEASSQTYVKRQRVQHYIAALSPLLTLPCVFERRLYDPVLLL